MEPRILHVNGFMIMGTATRITMDSESVEEFRSIWNDFESWHEQIKLHSTDQCYYGISFATEQEGVIDYVAGMAVKEIETIPEGLILREVPGADYAVFACNTQTIGETYRHIFSEWLPASGHQFDGSAPSFEKYPPAGDTKSPVLIHIPIRQQEEKR